MNDAEARLVQWLRDAHAMEKQAEQMLSAQISRLENYPQLKAQIEEHLEETKVQALRLEERIKALDFETSLVKDVGGQLLAFAQAVTGMFADDEVIKGSLASYTFEHLEIGSYRILIAAAEQLGDEATAEVCRKNLREEEAMANWLSEAIGPTTMQFLSREVLDLESAKR